MADPLGISGCQLWLKADAIVGLNDGDSIGTWSDQSGNGHDATAAGALRPTYKTGILDGKAVVRFDGTNAMTTASFSLNPPKTVFIVANNPAGTHVWLDGLGLYSTYFDATSSTNIRMYAGAAVNATVPDCRPYGIIAGVFNGASSVLAYNGTPTTGDSGADNASGFTLGASGGGAPDFVGDEVEILAYDSALDVAPSEVNRQKVEGYLAWRWGLQAQLPTTHPYYRYPVFRQGRPDFMLKY